MVINKVNVGGTTYNIKDKASGYSNQIFVEQDWSYNESEESLAVIQWEDVDYTSGELQTLVIPAPSPMSSYDVSVFVQNTNLNLAELEW